MTARMCAVLAFGLLLLTGGVARAHKASDGHLRLTLDGADLVGQLELGVRDLDGALPLDADGDGAIRWRELVAAAPIIAAYVRDRLDLRADGSPCALVVGADVGLVDLSDGAYYALPLRFTCPRPPTVLTLGYRLLFDVDALHHGLVHLDAGRTAQTVIVRDASPVTVDVRASTSFGAFVRLGVWHIWSGFDHVLFLLALLLPALLPARAARRDPAALQPATAPPGLRRVVTQVFEIVTAFTLAHSITLIVSALGLVTLPSRLVETAIALSVAVAALNNLVRAVDARWAVAFALGLLHGFGFSSVLVDAGLPSHELVGALLGFNLGVELGQLAIVVTVVPLLYLVRRTTAYRVLVWVGSAAIGALAIYWAVTRFVA